MAIDATASAGEVGGGDSGSLGTAWTSHFDTPAGEPKAGGSRYRRANTKIGACVQAATGGWLRRRGERLQWVAKRTVEGSRQQR
jgi:hypothetical protein